MRCPYCRHADSRVVDSREADDGALIRRRRSCPECGRRFTTVEEAILAVVKRSGVTEPFSRTKVAAGRAQGVPGPAGRRRRDRAARPAGRGRGARRRRRRGAEPGRGLAILGPLRDLDEVAYLRFASVYRSFESLSDFEREIEGLRAGRAPTGEQPQVRPASLNGRHT